MNFYIPTYPISLLKQPVAYIILPGKTLIVRKLPRKETYFLDKDLGLFHIDPANALNLNQVPHLFYDMRNCNNFDPGKFAKLYEWGSRQGLYKIKRTDVNHAIRLRGKKLTNLIEEQRRQQLEIRKFITKVQSEAKKKNEAIEQAKQAEGGGLANPDEYPILTDDDIMLLIVKNLFESGYIDSQQQNSLTLKLNTKVIIDVESLITEIDQFSDVRVNEPLPFEAERILDDYYTYNPKEVVRHIERGIKVRNGLKKLRAKPVFNYFPSTYLLFGCVGIGVVIMIWLMYSNTGGQDLGSFFPK